MIMILKVRRGIMPTIRPSADVRNNYPEISRMCKETGQPVYITVNGKGDTAIIDIAVLDELFAKIDLYEKAFRQTS